MHQDSQQSPHPIYLNISNILNDLRNLIRCEVAECGLGFFGDVLVDQHSEKAADVYSLTLLDPRCISNQITNSCLMTLDYKSRYAKSKFADSRSIENVVNEIPKVITDALFKDSLRVAKIFNVFEITLTLIAQVIESIKTHNESSFSPHNISGLFSKYQSIYILNMPSSLFKSRLFTSIMLLEDQLADYIKTPKSFSLRSNYNHHEFIVKLLRIIALRVSGKSTNSARKLNFSEYISSNIKVDRDMIKETILSTTKTERFFKTLVLTDDIIKSIELSVQITNENHTDLKNYAEEKLIELAAILEYMSTLVNLLSSLENTRENNFGVVALVTWQEALAQIKNPIFNIETMVNDITNASISAILNIDIK